MKRSDFLSLLGLSSLAGLLSGMVAKRADALPSGSAPNLNPLTNGTISSTGSLIETFAPEPGPVSAPRPVEIKPIDEIRAMYPSTTEGTWLADDQVPNWHDLAFIYCRREDDPVTFRTTITATWNGPLDAMIQVCREIVETPTPFGHWDKVSKAFGLVLVGKHFGNMGGVWYYYRRDPSKSSSATQFSFTVSDTEIVAMEWRDVTEPEYGTLVTAICYGMDSPEGTKAVHEWVNEWDSSIVAQTSDREVAIKAMAWAFVDVTRHHPEAFNTLTQEIVHDRMFERYGREVAKRGIDAMGKASDIYWKALQLAESAR